MLHCGIIGLPLSGKSTVFNVITRAGAEVKPYAGGKTDPNKAVVPVPGQALRRAGGDSRAAQGDAGAG